MFPEFQGRPGNYDLIIANSFSETKIMETGHIRHLRMMGENDHTTERPKFAALSTRLCANRGTNIAQIRCMFKTTH
jgi:hypothetical protein